MKIPPVGCTLFYADRRTDRLNDTNSSFSQFYENAYKFTSVSNLSAEKILKDWWDFSDYHRFSSITKTKTRTYKYVSAHSGLCGTIRCETTAKSLMLNLKSMNIITKTTRLSCHQEVYFRFHGHQTESILAWKTQINLYSTVILVKLIVTKVIK